MNKTTLINRRELLLAVVDQYALHLRGLHGVAHWARVLENGIDIARTVGANERIVELFALLHDACRTTEDEDRRHGRDAAHLVRRLQPLLGLNDSEVATLIAAVIAHTRGRDPGDVDVATCWDADRLDIWRVGLVPDESYMETSHGRMLAGAWSKYTMRRAVVERRYVLPTWVEARWPELAETYSREA